MPGLVNFCHNPLLEAMLTISTWKGSFTSADKHAMADARPPGRASRHVRELKWIR